jgi:putative pyruvate formate lyase activating enzyme
MNQYTPMPNMEKPLDRRVSHAEYDELLEYAIKLGVKNAYFQSGGTADESFIPPFNLDGVR